MTGSFGDTDKNTETLIATSQEVARNFLAEPLGHISAQERLLAERIAALASALLTARERERTLREALQKAGSELEAGNDRGAKHIIQDALDALVASSGGQTQQDLGRGQKPAVVATEDGNA